MQHDPPLPWKIRYTEGGEAKTLDVTSLVNDWKLQSVAIVQKFVDFTAQHYSVPEIAFLFEPLNSKHFWEAMCQDIYKRDHPSEPPEMQMYWWDRQNAISRYLRELFQRRPPSIDNPYEFKDLARVDVQLHRSVRSLSSITFTYYPAGGDHLGMLELLRESGCRFDRRLIEPVTHDQREFNLMVRSLFLFVSLHH